MKKILFGASLGWFSTSIMFYQYLEKKYPTDPLSVLHKHNKASYKALFRGDMDTQRSENQKAVAAVKAFYAS